MEDDLTRIKEIELELNEIATRNNFIYDIDSVEVGDLIEGTRSRLIINVYKKFM